MCVSEPSNQIRLERRSPAHWCITFDIPPLNIFGPQNMAPLTAIVATLEIDKDVKVLFGLSHATARLSVYA
jgi:enoyl-CoA hydratase/carnithine racemase